MSRIVLFFVFLSLLAVVISFKSYREYHTSERSLKMSALDAPTIEEKMAAEKEMMAKEAAKPKVWKLVLDTPQLVNGQKIYQANNCAQCHGEKAQGNIDEEGPLLAGQHDWYVYSQLVAFKNGERKNEKMMPFIANLSDQDFKDVAAYIEKLRIVE